MEKKSPLKISGLLLGRSLKSFPVFPQIGIPVAFLLEVVHIIHHIIMNLSVAVFFFFVEFNTK